MPEYSNDGINVEYNRDMTPQKLSEDFFYEPLDFFEETAFDPGIFKKNQSFLIEKVRIALATMEDDIQEARQEEDGYLSSTFHIETWTKLIQLLEDSLKDMDNIRELTRKIIQCGVTFYKELGDPIRSIQQFDYLLHICPEEPEHWGSYGLCLIEMSDQRIVGSFDFEKRGMLCFIRGARLSLAHLLAHTGWLQINGREHALKCAMEYYYNASDAYPNPVARKGIYIVKMLTRETPTPEYLQENQIMFEKEDVTREIKEIAAMAERLRNP